MKPYPEKPKRTLRRIHPIVYVILGVLAGAALMAVLPVIAARLNVVPVTLPLSFTESEFTSPAIDVAISKDGIVALAVENADGTANIYLRQLAAQNDTIPMFKGNVRTLAENLPRFGELEFTADGKRLIVSPDGVPDNHTVRLIHVDDGNTWEFSGDYAASNLTGNGTGTLAGVIASGNVLTNYDFGTGELMGQETTAGQIYQIAFPGGGVPLWIAEDETGEMMVHIPNHDPVDFLPEGTPRDIVITPQGDRVIAAVDDKLLLHNLELAGATFGGMENIGIINRLAVMNDWLAIAGDNSVDLQRYQTVPGYTTLLWRSERILTAHTGAVTGLAFLGDGKHLLTAGRDGQLILWNFVTGAQVWKMGI
jgi:WD40 repeat protein